MDYGDLRASVLVELEWVVAARRDRLTLPGLKRLRHRLLFAGDFPPSPERDRLLIAVNDLIADRLGCDPSEIPGSPLLVPDFPPDDALT